MCPKIINYTCPGKGEYYMNPKQAHDGVPDTVLSISKDLDRTLIHPGDGPSVRPKEYPLCENVAISDQNLDGMFDDYFGRIVSQQPSPHPL